MTMYSSTGMADFHNVNDQLHKLIALLESGGIHEAKPPPSNRAKQSRPKAKGIAATPYMRPTSQVSLCKLFGVWFCRINGATEFVGVVPQVHPIGLSPGFTPNSAQRSTPDNLQSVTFRIICHPIFRDVSHRAP
jgi:hypothetical protein